jgi:hypothetical protein
LPPTASTGLHEYHPRPYPYGKDTFDTAHEQQATLSPRRVAGRWEVPIEFTLPAGDFATRLDDHFPR